MCRHILASTWNRICATYTKLTYTNRSPHAKSPPNNRNNSPKCGRTCTRGTSPPTKLVNDDGGGDSASGEGGDSGGGDGNGNNGGGNDGNDNDNGGNGGGGDTATAATASHQWQRAQTQPTIN